MFIITIKDKKVRRFSASLQKEKQESLKYESKQNKNITIIIIYRFIYLYGEMLN